MKVFLISGLLLMAAAAKPFVDIVRPALTAKPSAPTFRNPLKKNGADPCLFFHDGYYYLSTTTAVDVKVRRARHLKDLPDAPDTVVWKDDTPGRSRDIWAAEFHFLNAKNGDGKRWYLYYTASGGPEPSHRMYVAESAGDSPLGPYTYKAQLLTDVKNEQYAIDGTVLSKPNGELYFFWCGRPSPAGQGLYVSHMKNPWTLSGERTYLPADGFGCQGVREGPEVLQHGGKVDLIYSMCGASTPDYRLGMLQAGETADLTDASVWAQYPKLLFARVDQRGVWGPGHCFFFKSPDGKEDWIAYHAKSGTNDTYGDRSTRAQKFTWDAGGVPNFGLPVSVDTDLAPPSGEKK